MTAADWESYADRHRGAIFGIVGAVGGILQAWNSRGALSPDLLNYLALARTLLANGWNASINGYWSPLYSWLLTLPMSLHLVTSHTELFWVHGINLGIFLGAMLCFHVFLSHTLRLAAIRVGPNYASWARIETWWYLSACAIFLYATFEWLPNSLTSPDLLQAAFLFLSAGFLAAILCRDRAWPNYIVLGQALALAYLAKAAAFPLALLFFVMLLFLSRGEKWRWGKCLSTVAAFAIIAGPFLYVLSKKEGHATFGESGKVNFLMYSDGLPKFWQGEGLAIGANLPSVERICENPTVFAFRGIPPGVYLPSYEPSRWYAGLVPRIQLRQEFSNLRAGWHTLEAMAGSENDLFLGFVLLFIISGVTTGLKAVKRWWFLWLPAACGTVMFWIVHVEDRFIAPLIVLGSVGLFTGTLMLGTRKPRLVTKVLLALLLIQGGKATINIVKGIASSGVSSTRNAENIVAALEKVGLPAGSKVAVIGSPGAFHWAWLGRYFIVSEVPESGKATFLGTGAPERERLYRCLEKTGAQAVVVNTEVPALLEAGWQKVGLGETYVKILNKN